jgi:lysophospholipase L1-like esterase
VLRVFAVLLGSLLLVPDPVLADPLDASAADPWGGPADAVGRLPDGSALVELLREDLRPETRARLVAELCDRPEPLAPERVADLLRRESPWEAQIDAARLLVCRPEPELVPLAWRGFVASKTSAIAYDPDIFERLLRSLEGRSAEELAAGLHGEGIEALVEMAWADLVADWVQPLTQAGAPHWVPTLGPERRAAVRARARDLVDGLLADGPEGLIGLQTDSGDELAALFHAIQASLLAAMLEHGSLAAARAAAEAAADERFPAAEPLAALRSRLARERDPSLAELLPRLEEAAAREPPHWWGVDHPVRPLAVPPAERDWVVASEPVRRIPAGAVPLALVTAVLASWVALLRGLPNRRKGLFRAGAVAAAPLGLILAEGLLALAGAAPDIDFRPTFHPTREPQPMFQERELEGVPYALTVAADTRRQAFIVDKPAGRWRVVVLGGSSVHGTHYLAEEAFGAVLVERLRVLHPGRDVELINAGIGGAVSDEVARAAAEMLPYEPDLFVVYLGHNDLSHLPQMAGFRSVSSSGIALRYLLDRSRVVRVVRELLPPSVRERARQLDADGGFRDLKPPQGAELELLQRLAEHNARDNLQRLARSANEAGVAVLFVVQGQSADACPPLEPDVLDDLCFREAQRRIAVEAGRLAGVPVVDGAAAVRSHAGGGPEAPAGWDYYWDYIHPTRLGHAVLGEAIAPAASALLVARSAAPQ